MKLQINISGEAEILLNRLTSELNTKHRDVVLDALALYSFAVEQAFEGRRIGSVEPVTKEFTMIATPTLESIRRKYVGGNTDAYRTVSES